MDVWWSDCEIRLQFTLDRESRIDMSVLTNEIEAEVEADFFPIVCVSSDVTILPVSAPVPAPGHRMTPLGSTCAIS